MSSLRVKGFKTLTGVLLFVTTLEWSIFLVRDSVPEHCVVPALLGLSAVKFAMVVDWYVRLGTKPGWLARAIPTALVVLGGTSLGLVAAFG